MSAWALLFSLLMVVANALFVAFEFSLVALRRADIQRLSDKGNRAARRVLGQMDSIDDYLAACQFGITLSSLALTAAFEPAVQAALAPFLQTWVTPTVATAISLVFAVSVATGFQVIFGELFPKTVAITIPTTTAIWTSRPMLWVHFLSTPLNATYNRVANWIVKRVTGKSVQEAHETQAFDAEILLGLAFERGYIDDDQRELMNAVLAFSTRTAREVMTPADRVVRLDIGDDAQTVYRRMRSARHSRYPVFDGDELLGYVIMHDVFRQRLNNAFDLSAIVRKMAAVPETVHLDRLRAEYHDHPIVAVFDERNQFVGIVTSEDLMEEIVGEILDEDEEPDLPPVQPLPSGALLIDGTALIEEVFDVIELEVEIPDGVDTFGGLLLSRLGKEPSMGDAIDLETWTFVVQECEGFSILLVEGTPKPIPGEPGRPVA